MRCVTDHWTDQKMVLYSPLEYEPYDLIGGPCHGQKMTVQHNIYKLVMTYPPEITDYSELTGPVISSHHNTVYNRFNLVVSVFRPVICVFAWEGLTPDQVIVAYSDLYPNDFPMKAVWTLLNTKPDETSPKPNKGKFVPDKNCLF